VKTLLTFAALLSLAAPAQAETHWRFENGDRLSSSCYYGAYGWQCRSWWNGTGQAAQVIRVPANMEFNTNPAWGKGCRSCADVSK
jgi:hypothetical protein